MCSILRPKTFTSVHQRLIRMFFEYLDFSVQYGEGHIDNDRSWELFVLSTRSESDEIYDVIESDKGEEVYPRRDSICQLLLDVFGMDIKKNIRLVHIQEIWFNAQSLLFLKWFMSTIKSETGVTYRDIGQSLILRIASWTDISRFYWNNFELVRDKVKLLVVKGASLHYTMHRQSPTTVAMGKAFRFHWWCKILLALGTNIQSFVEDEIEQGPLQEEGWNKETLMELFRDLIRNNLDKVKLERFDISSCIKCGSLRRTLWEFHLEDIKSGDFICEVNDDEEFDDEEFNNDDDEVDDDEEVVVDDDEVDEVEEVDNDAETDDNGDSSNDEVYKRMLCDACRESLERPIPGSFVH